jgi:hypothetical protein
MVAKNHGSDVDKGSCPRSGDIYIWFMTYSSIPPTCSQWTPPPKIIGPFWASKCNNSLHPPYGRIRTKTSTLLSQIKIEELDFQCSASF